MAETVHDSQAYIGDKNGSNKHHGQQQHSKSGHRHDTAVNANHIFRLGNEAHHSMVDSMETVTLSWENVSVYVNPKNRACCRGPDPMKAPKQVLRNVYGHVKSGTLLAIIGASGSGKTTLLNTLTSRVNNETLTYTGDIKVNGIDVGTGIRNISAYVQQDDLFIATMTVKEHLTFRALLRMEQEVSTQRRLERVNEVIKELGLTKCQDNMIGDPGRIKGISGGEMRRLSFASEILTNPPLLFCDEPTSGLDSFMAENIVQTLAELAGKGKTVLCTIHQPSSEVFALFHHVLIMAEGRVAFLGDAEGALRFYKETGFPCPVNYNPADFYIKTMAVIPGKETECRQRIEDVCDKFADSAYAKAILSENRRIAENPNRSGVIFEEAFSGTSRYEATWYQQFGAVFARSWKTTLREPMVIRVRVVQTVVLALLLGLIYLQLKVDQPGVMNINGVLFLMLTNMTFSNVFGVLNSFPLETPIFLREYGIGLYRVDIYFISKCIAEVKKFGVEIKQSFNDAYNSLYVPFILNICMMTLYRNLNKKPENENIEHLLPSFIFIPLLFCAITYWMVGLYASFEAFLIFTGVLLLVANISVSFGYIVSAAASSVSMALAVAPPLMIPLLMFGGFFLNSESTPVYFIWLEYLSWFKYANELIAVNQWENIDSIDCGGNTNTSGSMGPSSKCLYKNGEQVIDYLHFEKDNLWLDVGLLIMMLFVYRFIAFLILFLKAHLSKR